MFAWYVSGLITTERKEVGRLERGVTVSVMGRKGKGTEGQGKEEEWTEEEDGERESVSDKSPSHGS